MASLAEYFENNRYKGSYEFGDRIFGYYNKIPFIGSVGSDRVVSDLVGPEVTVTLDLPIMVDGQPKIFIVVKHKDIKSLLRDYTESVDNPKITRKVKK